MAEKEYIERKKVISHIDIIANDQQAADDYKKQHGLLAFLLIGFLLLTLRLLFMGVGLRNMKDYHFAQFAIMMGMDIYFLRIALIVVQKWI